LAYILACRQKRSYRPTARRSTRRDELVEEMRQTRPNNWMERQITWTDTDAEEREAELAEALEKQTAEEAETEAEEAAKQLTG
jgi:hypothetical protein